MPNQNQQLSMAARKRLFAALSFSVHIPFFVTILIHFSDTPFNKIFWYGLVPAAAGLLIIYLLGSLVLYAVIKNKDLKLTETRAEILEKKEKLLAGQKKYSAKNTALAILANTYLWSYVLIVLILNSAAFAGVFKFVSESVPVEILYFPLSVLLSIFGTLFLKNLFVKIEDSIDGPHMYLPRHEYPEIWDTAIAAKIETGLKGNLAIFAVPGINVGITMHKKTHVLLVGFEIPRLLSRAELYAVFLHEFGHAANKDNRKSRKRGRLAAKLERLTAKNKLHPAFLFIPVFVLISKNFTIFTMLTSYRAEQNADKVITKQGDTRNFINAIAKMDLFGIWLYELPKQNAYISESAPKDYFEERFKIFEAAYLANKQRMDDICLNQLEARIDTHPNLPERMKTFNVYDFTVDFSKDNTLEAELEKIREAVMPFVLEDWEKQHKTGYIKNNETVLKWRNADTVPAEHYLELANAYFELCDYNNALKYYDLILAQDADNPMAVYRKGLILCDRYDDAGIDYLYRSISNPNYSEIAFLRLGSYLQYMGLAEKREQLRDGMYLQIDRNIGIKASKKFKIKPHSLSSDMFNKIRDCVHAQGSRIFVAFLANKQINGRDNDSLFLCFKQETDENDAVQSLQEIDLVISSLGLNITVYPFKEFSHMGNLPKLLKNYRLD